MATKQVQSFQDYFESLDVFNMNTFTTTTFIGQTTTVFGSPKFCRFDLEHTLFAFLDACNYLAKQQDVQNLKNYVDDNFPKWYIDKPEGESSQYRLGRIHVDVIKGYLNSANGVYIPNGVSFNIDDKSQDSSWIGYGSIDASSYGDSSNTTIDCNVCKGVFSMEKVYINDLYVKNLHTDSSIGGDSSSGSGSSSEMDEATISTLTSDTIFVKEIRTNEGNNIIKIRNGITFSGDINYSSIKYQKVNFYYLGYDGLRELEANYCCGIFAFRDDVFTGGNLYAHDINLMQSDASTFSLQDKIKALEARIAALESK